MNYLEKAKISYDSLYKYFAEKDEKQHLNNVYPLKNIKEDNKVFNFWWLAHSIDTSIHMYIVSRDEKYIKDAIYTYEHSKERNGNTLINEFYDDMLWHGLAMERLYQVTKDTKYLEEAVLIWNDLVNTGWNEIEGGGFAWKKTQMYYKNTPANSPFVILSLRLYKILEEDRYLDWALKTYEWHKNKLVDKDTAFVHDGVNRLGDGNIDKQWKFTYNQGVYIGSNIELYHLTGDKAYLQEAIKNAYTSIRELSIEGVFKGEGKGGDSGLFKGIFYRYLVDLITLTEDKKLKGFIESSCENLWNSCFDGKYILASDDWRVNADLKTDYSTQLSAIMALQSATILEKNNIL